MMLRTPPVRQKRSSSPLPQVKGQHLATVAESKSTPSPSKRLRRPSDVNIDETDEPFTVRSLDRESPWGMAQQPLDPRDQYIDDLAINPHYASRKSVNTDDDGEPELDWDSLRCSYKCRNLVKSDVLTSLDSKEKQVVELRAALDKLKVAYATSDEERRKLKKRVHGLEQGLAAAKERETALYKQRTQESERSGELIKTHMAQCAELEAMLQVEMKKNAEVEARALELETRVAATEDAKEKNLQCSVRETSKLTQELERVETDSLFSIARVNAELEMKKAHVQGAEAEAKRLSSQINELQENMAESLAERLKLEHQIYDVDIHTASTRTTGTSEAELVIRHLKEELSQSEAELRDARKLKQKHVNAELLKERLASEKARAERAEAELSNLANLESKVKELEIELSSWKEMIATLPGVETCNDVRVKFAELQREVVAAVAKTGEFQAQMVKLQTAVELAESAKHQAEAAADAAQAETVDAVLSLKRAERKVSLLAKERDGLKAILESYDEEENVIASHQKSVTGIANLATPEKAKDFRIQQLEEALVDCQQQVKVLGEEVEKSMKSTSEQRHRAENLGLMLVEAEDKYKAIDREAGQLRSEVSILEAKVGRGESDLSNTKVLHMIINPEAEVHGLSEAQALRARLELHERNFDGCRVESPENNSGVEKEKITVLTQRVTALEKREARYKQVFANKISVFREACGLIFGYKVQMNEEQDSSTGSSITLFTLRSIYSTTEEEQIQFQFKAGTLEMIATEYVSSPELQRQVNTFVRNYKSIPAFIANLTMEQFNKTTLGKSLVPAYWHPHAFLLSSDYSATCAESLNYGFANFACLPQDFAETIMDEWYNKMRKRITKTMIGSKDRVGSFELRCRPQDTVQGLISEAYIQEYFQEVFLQLFYEDPDFREQVLKCLLTGDNDEGTVQVSKPRRTWFNGMSGIQEVSREEARYIHICSENPSIDSDLSTEAGDERYHIALQTKPTIQDLPKKHMGELKADASLGTLAKEIPHSTVVPGCKDRGMNHSGVPCGVNSKINCLLHEAGTATTGPESLEDRPKGPVPSEVESDSQHKGLEKSLTCSCVHERRIQTWKANPLFLLSNIDSDSNDSWQQESPNVAWMDDLENGKMLQEVKMRKMKRFEESRPVQKAEGYDRSRVNSKSDHEGDIQCNVERLPHYPTEESKTLQVEGRKKLNEDKTENHSIGGFVRDIPSFIIVIPKQTSGTSVTSCPEKKLEECLALGKNKITNLPHTGEGPPLVCLHGDDVGDLTSSSPSAETTALHENHTLKPRHKVVPQELPFVFLHEDEKALLKQPSPHVSISIHELDGEVRLASGRISGAQDAVVSKFEKPKSLPESISPVEGKVISEKGLNAPVSNISSSVILDGTNRIEEERKLPAPAETEVNLEKGPSAAQSNISSSAILDETNRIEKERNSLAPVETKVIFEKGLNAPISNISSFAMLDEANRIEEERSSLAPVEIKVIFEKGLNDISNISSSTMLDEANRIEEERKSLAPVETKVIFEKGLNAPVSNISSSTMLDEGNRIEEERKSLAPVETKVIFEKGLNAPISNISSSTMLDETNRIEEERKTFAPVETKFIFEKGLNAPTSNISTSTMLDESNRIEEKSKSQASSYRKHLSKPGMKLVSMTEKNSLPPSCAIDDQREEICLSNSISESIRSLIEELHMPQRRIPVLVTPSQASVCGSITEASDRCRDMLSEKEISSPLAPKSSIKSPLVSIAEKEKVVDPPKPLAHNIFQPIATRTPFRPGKDIQWQPPKRNIQFLGMKRMKSPATQHPPENVKQANTKWDAACDCPQLEVHNLAKHLNFKSCQFVRGLSLSG